MIDADSARVARREALGHSPSVKLGGKTYKLPVELSIATVELLDSISDPDVNEWDVIQKAIPMLFGDKAEEVEKVASIGDVFYVFRNLLKEYGLQSGNGKASPPSSGTTGTRPRRSSKRSTEST
jgi:hypothetical protein